jgi:outer membrane biosynthesis protein TonB
MAAAGEKEGSDLLGPLSFTQLDDDRFKCVETGHEMLAKDKDSYSQSKRCRLGFIDFALKHKKPPLNMFKQDPANRSKLICKLTGDTVNKSEEHVWKHINGKRFLNKLELKEMGAPSTEEALAEEAKAKAKDKKKSKDGVKNKIKNKKEKEKEKQKPVEEIISEVRESPDDKESRTLEELDFWMPPDGERWDFDDGGDRWGSDDESEEGSDGENMAVEDENSSKDSEELSTRAKRMSIEVGPSSFATRKKKSRKDPAS